MLRLMNQGDPAMRHAWFVLDELASLQRLPQLHTALTENRKSGNPVVIGFQGRSQLEVRYGHEAESMLSQPATKIFLAYQRASCGEVDLGHDWRSGNGTREGDGEHASSRSCTSPGAITMKGERSRSCSRRKSVAYERLHALLKVDNLVVPFGFPYLAPVKVATGIHPKSKIKPRVVEIGKRHLQPSSSGRPGDQSARVGRKPEGHRCRTRTVLRVSTC